MDLDVDKLRWHPDPPIEETPTVSTSPVQRTADGRVDGLFIKGPIPLAWFTPATSLPGKSIVSVCCALWYLRGLKKSDTVRLTHAVEALFNVKPRAANRALRILARTGLVSVDQRPGQSPAVTILPPPAPESKDESD